MGVGDMGIVGVDVVEMGWNEGRGSNVIFLNWKHLAKRNYRRTEGTSKPNMYKFKAAIFTSKNSIG